MEDDSLPHGLASVWIGMSGQPTLLLPAQPNYHLQFALRSEYWIAFGTYAPGEVLDVAAIGNAAKIDFPGNIFAMDATLNPDESLTIAPTHVSVKI